MRLRIALLLILGSTFVLTSHAQQRTVDYRYAPAYWHTAIGFPDDWQKTLMDDQGRLLYDFGPGPYVHPKTRLTFGVQEATLEPVSQAMESARVPVVQTTLRAGAATIMQTAFSARLDTPVPAPPGEVVRLEGYVGTPGWATPPEGTDPAFRSVAWGANRPVRYRLKVPPSSQWQVVMGFAESYRSKPGLRVFRLEVEGSALVQFDPIAAGARNEPQVVISQAEDADGDGFLSVEVHSAATDPNTYLNALWLFPTSLTLSPDDIISGAMNDRAERYVNAGREQEPYRPARLDVMQMQIEADTLTPMLNVTTSRLLSAQNGNLFESERPFLISRPASATAKQTETGWHLVWPRGTQHVAVIVANGATPDELPTTDALLIGTRQFWQGETAVPFDRLRVSDAGIQALIDASLRTLYQSREVVDGYPQFQPGMALYRGLWVHDSAYLIETALMMNDTLGARQALEGVLAFQHESGQVEVSRPATMNRETALLVWLMSRYTRLTDDDDWLRARWDHVVRGIGWIRTLREQTLNDPATPYYGLMPPGFADGGLGGVSAEYSSVYWALISLEAAIQDARRLGDITHATAWQSLYDDLLASWRKAAIRDLKRDEHGNLYLPVRIGKTTDTPPPPQAQWMVTEAATFGDFLALDDSLVTGTLAMLADNEVQGLVRNIGWLEDGIWAYYGGFYGLIHLLRGDRDMAIDVLYAFANHATPHGAWAEEQLPKSEGTRTAGDYPHAWGSGFFIRFVRYLLAVERGPDLVLLDGVPAQWLYPGAELAANGIRTDMGVLTLHVAIDPFGHGGTISVEPIGKAGMPGQVRVNLRALRELGYVYEDGTPLPDEHMLPWGAAAEILVRQGG